MTTEQIKESWERAAARVEAHGKPVLATALRNAAWLTEHPEGWLQFIAESKSE